MEKNNLTETVVHLYQLFCIQDSTIYVKWQIRKYLEQNQLVIKHICEDQEYINQVAFLKKLIDHDSFFPVLYKFKKIQECLVLNELKGSTRILNTYLCSCIEMLYKILSYLIYEKIHILSCSLFDQLTITNSLYDFLIDDNSLPIDFLLFYPFPSPVFQKMNIHECAEYMRRESYLFRERMRKNICIPEKKEMIIRLKNEIDPIFVDHPFLKIFRDHFLEMYSCLLKSIQPKSRNRKKTKPTSMYEYAMDLFQDSFDSSNSST